ncbi:MAG: microcin C ABC transporter permease YejB [Alphaproteobacteria bacterium]|nr:MAG: microcin C ABC transporter permease YejB [Alphaproteobacteria bacterium]
MAAYILRRLLLMIPTMLGIMAISFAVIQFAPGGPVEQVIAQLSGQGGSATDRISGAGADFARDQTFDQGESASKYRGAQGLDPEFIARLERQFGFDKPPLERFGLMLWNYLRFDFGESYFRKVTVIDLIIEKMPVSISLGLWITLLSYGISIPLGVRKAVKDGSTFDMWTSGVIIVAYAIPGFLFAILLMVLFAGGSYLDWFPLRGLLTEGIDAGACLPGAGFRAGYCLTVVVPDYFWHLALPLTALALSSFATTTLLTKNSFLDEIRKQYVMTARAKGLTERQVLYGHVFRNAMLIVIAGFPGAFISAFFTGSLLIETIFTLDGLGLLGYRSVIERDYPVVFATLYIFSLMALLIGLLSDLVYTWIDPRIDFESREV